MYSQSCYLYVNVAEVIIQQRHQTANRISSTPSISQSTMKFDLDGLTVYFPYNRIYLEQYQYMRSLKQTLDAGGHCLLEMATGTGKTVSVLSLITSYQLAHENCGKLVYCTRTVPEMNSVMEELGSVLGYREDVLREERERAANANNNSIDHNEETVGNNVGSNGKRRRRVQKNNPLGPAPHNGGAGGTSVLALCLSSRRNMCIHERVLRESDREGIDAACRSMTAPWAIEKAKKNNDGSSNETTCEYYDGFTSAGEATSMPSGTYIRSRTFKAMGQVQKLVSLLPNTKSHQSCLTTCR